MNDRQKTILNCLVDHFIDAFKPVSSSVVKNRLNISLSPASVRQVFSTLDDDGYIQKLHTSSGRVPTDKGYRFYVDNIPQPNGLFLDRHIDTHTYYGKFQFLFDQFLDRLAQKLPYIMLLNVRLSQMQNVATLQYVSMSAFNGWLLIFHRVGVVSRRPVTFPFDVLDLDHKRLVNWLSYQDAFPVSEAVIEATFSKKEADFIHTLQSAIQLECAPLGDRTSVFIKNIRQCLSLADYSTKACVNNMLDFLDDTPAIIQRLEAPVKGDEFEVAIGSELNDNRLRSSSLIRVPITLNSVRVASLGILGPMRMNYAKIMRWFRSEKTLAELTRF